jgi:hypothetical protein
VELTLLDANPDGLDVELLARGVALLGKVVPRASDVRVRLADDFVQAGRDAVDDPNYAAAHTAERLFGCAFAKAIGHDDDATDLVIDPWLPSTSPPNSVANERTGGLIMRSGRPACGVGARVALRSLRRLRDLRLGGARRAARPARSSAPKEMSHVANRPLCAAQRHRLRPRRSRERALARGVLYSSARYALLMKRSPDPTRRETTRPERREAMAKQRKTSVKAGKAASKVLRDGRTSRASKTAAASALSQRAPKRGKK